MVRPDGLAGPLVIEGNGRDLATGIDGEPYLIGAAATSVTVAAGPDRAITAVAAQSVMDRDAGGDHHHLDGLIGVRAGSGFRRALAETAPDLVVGGSLVHLLLDDTPPAALIAGSVLVRAGLLSNLASALPVGGSAAGGSAAGGSAAGGTPSSPRSRPRTLPVGICAGWAPDGAMVRAVVETGIPLLGWGPPAPDLNCGPDGSPDLMAWQATEPLAPESMRRRRLIDLWRGVGTDGRTASAPLRVEVRFRDTYGEPDDVGETVVHEYGFTARIDPSTWLITAATATPGPLPAPECPSAAASAERLVGLRVDDLRTRVRDDLTGTSTCTHLNDLFRSLADVRSLWDSAALARGESR
jgi:hypothetical protein